MLKRRCMKAFLTRSLYRNEKGAKQKEIECMRRTLIFIRWYNHVHDQVPLENLAVKHRKAKLFTFWASHAYQMRHVRFKRKLM
jgi:hypothetical protein